MITTILERTITKPSVVSLKNSFRPLDFLSESDINQLKSTSYYDYNDFRKNDHQAQRCFIKE